MAEFSFWGEIGFVTQRSQSTILRRAQEQEMDETVLRAVYLATASL